jgi:hypothetical protein
VSNWDFVVPYTTEATAWLVEQGFPHPAAAIGNRAPTLDELNQALAAVDDSLVQVDLEAFQHGPNAGQSFRLRGEIVQELTLLRQLATVCGQLWLYPDTGEPAVIVDESTDPRHVGNAWLRCRAAANAWQAFYVDVHGE